MSRCVLLVFLAVTLPHDAFGQALRPGDRIRVTAPPLLSEPQRGRLVTLTRDTLLFESSGADLGLPVDARSSWVVPLELLTQLEMSQGFRGHSGQGFLIGAGSGLVVAFVGMQSCDGISCDPEVGTAAIVGAGTLVGGLLGLLFGAVVRTERWTPVSLDVAR
jgi:hypothetical protein